MPRSLSPRLSRIVPQVIRRVEGIQSPAVFPLAFLVLAGLLTPLLSSAADAAVLTVGFDEQLCDHTDLAQAITAAASGDELELALGAYTGASGRNFNINSKSLRLEGGFDGCSGQRSGVGPSTLNGQGADTVLEIQGSGSHRVELINLVLTGGRDDADDGGAVGIHGDFEVLLFGVGLLLNESDRGAGVFIDGSQGASLAVALSEISANEAFLHGGGIYCTNGALVEILHLVTLENNLAGANGGAIHAAGDCRVRLEAGSSQTLFEGNEASGHGGAFHAEGGATVYADGGMEGNLVVRGNVAGVASGQGFGGAAYAAGSGESGVSRAILRRAQVIDNMADVGGAFYAESEGEVGISSLGLRCLRFPCQRVAGNRAPYGGVGFVGESGTIHLKEALIHLNEATEDASVLWVADGGVAEIQSSMVVNNGGEVPSTVRHRGAGLWVEGSTFANNRPTLHVFDTDQSFLGTGLILWGNHAPLFSAPSLVTELDCVVVESDEVLSPQATLVSYQPPSFRDVAGDDYRLRPGSSGIDLCELELPSGYPGIDIQGEPRVVGEATDAGADELSAVLFADGFESGGTAAWQ